MGWVVIRVKKDYYYCSVPDFAFYYFHFVFSFVLLLLLLLLLSSSSLILTILNFKFNFILLSSQSLFHLLSSFIVVAFIILRIHIIFVLFFVISSLPLSLFFTHTIFRFGERNYNKVDFFFALKKETLDFV